MLEDTVNITGVSILFLLGSLVLMWTIEMVLNYRTTQRIMTSLQYPATFDEIRVVSRKIDSQAGDELSAILGMEESEERKRKLKEWCDKTFKEAGK
jgi:hypothetical protein